MNITVTVDEDLLARARALTGIADRDELMDMALRALVERHAVRHLARLGGSEPGLQAIPRRRS